MYLNLFSAEVYHASYKERSASTQHVRRSSVTTASIYLSAIKTTGMKMIFLFISNNEVGCRGVP